MDFHFYFKIYLIPSFQKFIWKPVGTDNLELSSLSAKSKRKMFNKWGDKIDFHYHIGKGSSSNLGEWIKERHNIRVEEPADFSWETKAGELSEGESQYQYRLAPGTEPVLWALKEKLLKHFSFPHGKIIKTSWQMKNRCEAPLSFSLTHHSLQL